MSKTQLEFNQLSAAVNDFSEKMKNRLHEKAAIGKSGWNNDSSGDLCVTLRKKMEEYNNPALTKLEAKTKLVDIANFCLMVHLAIEEGR